ncbi:MAG TPA: type II toxin-antitoxin system VapC family toxin [Bosea sp. (in: a-proteobacteria)]|jgi:ribonuclease VapC|uniref:type II toxin-antitoxin system VapC family toxin n=1 Tax=Bosea sp. (in: a-proteobacteria) TaxID=1871050 RepID=UPI002DDD4CF1|nr:type II toxin-antitoxin system VapC family toxin [Bosea sp. (in: a-proteobacteria)]HEV2552898.1 type II toxin-antitoxin system VapC family toxin [Bosea sp. (in: a-proteobacteria)]
MTYLDASVIVAILGRESDRETLLARLEASPRPFLVSPTGVFEAVISLAAKKARDSRQVLDAGLITAAQASVAQFIADIGATEVTVTPAIGQAAIEAAKRYGRAVGSPAALNFGDCFAYACAKEHGAALLYKGGDFAQTDLA